MTDTTESIQTKINIGAEQSYKNLSMFPLLSDHPIPCEYLTRAAALSNDLIKKDDMDGINSAPPYKVASIADDNGFIAAAWDYIEQFARVDRQIGAVFLINGKIAGLVCLDGVKAFEKSFIKILESYAIRAVKAFASAKGLRPLKAEVIGFIGTAPDYRVDPPSNTGI